MGGTAEKRRAVTRKNTTGWATRAAPPYVWPPRFGHPPILYSSASAASEPGTIRVFPQPAVGDDRPSAEPMLPHTYTQNNKEVTLLLPLAADVRAKEVQFKCTSQQLSLSVRGVELRGELFLAVKPDESTWELEDEPTGRRLRIGLCKARPNHKWDCCFLHEVDVRRRALPCSQSRSHTLPRRTGFDHPPRLPRPDHRRAADRPGHHRALRQRCAEDRRELPLPVHRRAAG